MPIATLMPLTLVSNPVSSVILNSGVVVLLLLMMTVEDWVETSHRLQLDRLFDLQEPPALVTLMTSAPLALLKLSTLPVMKFDSVPSS